MRTPAWLLAGTAALAMGAAGCQLASRVESKAESQVRTAVRQVRSEVNRVTHQLGMDHAEGKSASKGLQERGDGFIGEVRFTVTRSGNEPSTVDYRIEEGKVRYDLLDAKGRSTSFVVADLPARAAFAVLPGSGKVVDIAPVTGPGDPPRNLDDSVVLRRPDQTDQVAGRLCETWKISTVDHEVEACAASGIAWFDLVPEWTSDHVQPRWSAELSRDGYFPLRLIIKDKRGHEQLRMAATQVREGPVDDARFEAPNDAHVAVALPGRLLPSAT